MKSLDPKAKYRMEESRGYRDYVLEEWITNSTKGSKDDAGWKDDDSRPKVTFRCEVPHSSKLKETALPSLCHIKNLPSNTVKLILQL